MNKIFFEIVQCFKEDMIDVPDRLQQHNYDCGAASVQAVMAYAGKEFESDELIKELNSKPHKGTRVDNIIEFFKTRKIDIIAKSMDVDELKSYLDKKYPVILAIQAWNDTDIPYKEVWSQGHYVVCIGYKDDKLLFTDPVCGKAYLTIDELKERWHDQDDNKKRYVNFGIVVKVQPKKLIQKMK